MHLLQHLMPYVRYSDITATGGATLTGAANRASLLRTSRNWRANNRCGGFMFLGKFSTQTTLKNFSINGEAKIILIIWVMPCH